MWVRKLFIAIAIPLAFFMGYKFHRGEWTSSAAEGSLYVLALSIVLTLLSMAEDQDNQGKRK